MYSTAYETRKFNAIIKNGQIFHEYYTFLFTQMFNNNNNNNNKL